MMMRLTRRVDALPTPEPASFVMAGSGVIVGLGYAWRRRRATA